MALAERLIEKEVIDTEELRQIVEANSPSVAIVPGTADAAVRRAADEPTPPRRRRRPRAGDAVRRND